MTADLTGEPPFILPLAARGATALASTATGLAAFLDRRPDAGLRDVTHTLVHGREQFEHRLAVVADTPTEAATALRRPSVPSDHLRTGVATDGAVRTVFAFTGQGGQYTGMAAGAYARYPAFREWMDRADALLDGVLPSPLLAALFDERRAAQLGRTDVAAPALLAVQFGIVRVLARYGVRPDVVLGHSVGEFGAAALAGAVSEEDALLLVAERGRLMVERTAPGAMLSVRCAPDSPWDTDGVSAIVADEPLVSVGVHNSPNNLVLSGDRGRLELIEGRLRRADVPTRRLTVSHAFHSPLLDPMADDFHKAADAVQWSSPTTSSWFSCAAGAMTSAPDGRYWREHLTQPVRFWDALSEVCSGGTPTVLVEIGAHPALVQLAARLDAPPTLVPTLERGSDAAVALAGAAAQAWCAGVPADLSGGVQGRRVHLPGYGFDRRTHSEKPKARAASDAPVAAAPIAPQAPAAAAAAVPAATRPTPRQVLAGIWTDLLTVSPEDASSFVAGGGDSLTLLRLRQRLQAELGTAPDLEELLAAGTFAAMVALLRDDVPGGPSTAVRAVTGTAVTTYQPSWAQKRMLFVDLMQSGSNQHNVTLAVDVAARVDRTAMAEAFADAQRRHSALRTLFHQKGGEFEAEIRDEPGVELIVVEAPLTDSDVQRWVRELNEEPQRCLGELPLRATLVLAPTRSLLVVTVHHALTDATSMRVMVEELAADYHRRRGGDSAPARADGPQFHDALADLDESEQRAAGESSAYWRDQLGGAPDLVPLPTDRPRPEVRGGAGAMWGQVLDRDLASQIRGLSAELNATTFSTMLAAYAILLRDCSGAEDMTIATPVSSRPTEASQRVFGLMLNTLVLRVRPADGVSFASLARSVGDTVLDGIRHSAFPFDRLVAELKPKRDPARTPLFSVMFAMPGDITLPQFDGSAARPVDLPGIGAKFDLTLYVTPTAEGGLRLNLEYDPALFDEATIQTWGDHYVQLLRAVVADPGTAPSVQPVETEHAQAPDLEPAPGSHHRPLSDLERYVATVWSENLEADAHDPAADFFEIGGHSLQVLGCLVEIQERFPETTIQDFFAYPTVEQFAARLTELGSDEPVGTGQSEVLAGPVPTTDGHVAAPAARVRSGGEVLLTGATGFLGVHLLAALLREPGRTVACLVRAGNGTPPRERLTAVVGRYAPDVLDELATRVRIIEGDLGSIDADELAAATTTVDEVIHAAAEVRHFGRVEHYSATNVAPTRMIADLATARGWRMAHMSTLSAVGAAPEDGPLVVLHEDDFDRGEVFDSPYARSKFEAELVVREAIAGGLDATIHRVGTLTGSSRTGVFLPDPSVNMMYQILRVILGSGLVPSAPGWGMDLTPVDFAADAILRLSRDPACSGRTFHVCNPVNLPSSDLVVILRELGYSVMPVAPDAVGAWLGRPEADAVDADAFAFLAQFVKPVATLVEYDAQATADALGDLRCPRPDAALLRTLLGHGIDTGFFPKSRLWDFVTRQPQAFGAAL